MIRYKCRECGRSLKASAYRASCPECGGLLVNTRHEPNRA